MIWTIYEIAINLFEGFLYTWFITKMLTKPKRKGLFIAAVSCGLLTAAALTTYLFFPMPEIDTWTFVFVVLYSFIFLKGSIRNKFFWNLLLIVLVLGIVGTYYQVMQLIFGVEMESLLEQTWYRLVFTFSGNALLWLVLFLVTRLSRFDSNGDSPSLLLLFTASICVLLIDLFFEIRSTQGLSSGFLARGCLLALSAGIMTIITYRTMVRSAKREQEYRYRETLLKEAGTQADELKEIYASMKKLRHDMSAYVKDVNRMIDEGHLSEKPEYFKELEAELMPSYSSGNIALDSVLSVKLSKFQRAGFEFRGTNLHYTGGINITDAALCSLVSNMLDNAYEALSDRKNQPGEHYVYFQFSYHPIGLMIICENPLLGIMPKMRKHSFLSNKREIDHGLGLSIMKQIAEDAGGQFNVVLSDGLFRILVSIPRKDPQVAVREESSK